MMQPLKGMGGRKKKGEQRKEESKKKKENRWTDIINSPRELTKIQCLSEWDFWG